MGLSLTTAIEWAIKAAQPRAPSLPERAWSAAQEAAAALDLLLWNAPPLPDDDTPHPEDTPR